MNIATILEDSARFFPDNTAVIDDDRTYTYSELNNYASRIASALSGYGISPGDYVGFCAPNSYDWLALYYGALKRGAVAVTFSFLLTRNEFQKILSDCRTRVLFTTEERLADLGCTMSSFRPDLVITDVAVIEVTEKGLVLREIAPGWTPEEVQSITEPNLIISDALKLFEL